MKIPYLQKWFKQESMALDKTATSYYYEEDKKALKFYTTSSKILEDLANEIYFPLKILTYYNTCNKIARMCEGEEILMP